MEKISIEKSNEGKWLSYYLSDGNILRVKHIMTEISKEINKDGSPIYHFKGDIVVDVKINSGANK